MVNADYWGSWNLIGAPKWHKVVNLDFRKALARKYPKKKRRK